MRIASSTWIEQQQDHWDLDIEPHRQLLDLKLGDLWRYKNLVLIFERHDFVLDSLGISVKGPYTVVRQKACNLPSRDNALEKI